MSLTSAQMSSILSIRETEGLILKGSKVDEKNSDKKTTGGAEVYPR
jgi:hypothetical protein